MNLQSVLTCPICSRAVAQSPIEHGRDYVIYRCSYCAGDFAHTELSIDYGEEYRRDESPLQLSSKLQASLTPEEQVREAQLRMNLKHALEFLKASSAKGKLLDVGCGVGTFAKLAEELGLEVYALDPAEEAIRYARENFGLKNAVAGSIRCIPPTWRNFDFITAFEVLEHLQQPRELAKKIHELLAAGGYFIMSVPNRDRLNVKLRRREISDYPPNHLTRWSKDTLNLFLNDLGFTNVAIKIGGINRWVLAGLLLPSKFTLKITAKKMKGLTSPTPAKERFFVYSPIWKFVLKSGDGAALLLQKLIGSRYGEHLIAFAQQPHSEPSSP